MTEQEGPYPLKALSSYAILDKTWPEDHYIRPQETIGQYEPQKPATVLGFPGHGHAHQAW